jgi:hypothetical protein
MSELSNMFGNDIEGCAFGGYSILATLFLMVTSWMLLRCCGLGELLKYNT